MTVLRLCVCLAALPALAGLAAAGDWPQWRGPERSGVSAETGLLRSWPKGGPRLLWKATGLGGGYPTPSVAAGRVFLLGSFGGDEHLMALDVSGGKKLWSLKVGAVGENTGPNYPGPRSTPTVVGGLVWALGSDGDLVCAEAATGKLLWRKNVEKEFGGQRGTWAYTESVLVDGDVVVCTPGGPTATLVALEKTTGKVVWKSAHEEYNFAGYASAIVAHTGPVKQYIQFLGAGLVGVDARTGKLLWRYRKNVGGTSCATPIFHDGCVFSTASGVEGAGGDALLRLIPSAKGVEAKEIYHSRGMLNHHGGVVRVGEHLYGSGGTGLVCLDFRTGKVRWRHRSVGPGSLLAADGHLYYRSTRGDVALVEVTSAGYREKGRFSQPHRSRFATFCHPVLANGRLYLRDADVLLCYDVKAGE